MCEWPDTDKESNETICLTNESCRRITRDVYQNAVWLMLSHNNSSLCF